MKKLYILLLLTLILNGCETENQTNNSNSKNKPSLNAQEQFDDQFKVSEEQTSNGLRLEISYLNLKASYTLPENCFLESSSTLKLDADTEGLVLKINGNDPNMLINHNSDNRFAYLIWSTADGQLRLIFNSFELEMNNDANYNTFITEDQQLSVYDKANDFNVIFSPYVSEGDEKFYQDIINNVDQVKSLFTTSKWFIATEILEDNNSTLIRLTKLFNGYNSANPSGYFEYYYTYQNEKFYLSKESFYTAKGLNLIDPILIKSVDFTQK